MAGEMSASRTRLYLGGASAALMTLAHAASAQTSNTVIGPPQLKDFRLESRQPAVDRPVVPLPTPAPVPTTNQAQPTRTNPVLPSPGTTRPAPPPPAPLQRLPAPATGAVTQPQAPTTTTRAPTARSPETTANAPLANDAAPPGADIPLEGPPNLPAEIAPEAGDTAPEAAPATPEAGLPLWAYGLPFVGLLVVGMALLRRRRRRQLFAEAAEAGREADAEMLRARAAKAQGAAPAVLTPTPPATPRPDPVPRPWLEFALTAERASFTDTEAEVMFELEIANKGGSPARNLRIDIKMFNAGAEQDKEIGAFFKTAGRESTKLNLPEVDAGVTGVIKGRVTMAREDMKALRMDERLLFIPVIAVNGLYDWGDSRTGQTGKSYVIGREVEQAGEKMAAFRVDQGPRIWRTVGQRPHKLAKKV